MPCARTEEAMRVYGGFSRALLSVSPVGTLAPVRGSDAKIEAGLAVYRNNVRAAYLRALNEAFPVVARLVGDGFFRFIAHEYFHAHPPASPLVAHYGDRLPAFLESFQPAAGLPYLADVARIEIAWLRAYHAAEAVPLGPAEILSRIGADPDRARVSLHLSLSIIVSPYPAATIWRHNHERIESALKPSGSGEHVLVLRPCADVTVSVGGEGVIAALQSLVAGELLGDAMARARAADAKAEDAEILQAILSLDVIIGAELEKEGE